MSEQKSKKKILVTIISVVILIVLVIGITYAAFTYSKSGTTVNTITTGTLVMRYEEGTINRISITNAEPTIDSEGKKLTGTNAMFDFTLTANAANTEIKYEVVAHKENSSTLDNQSLALLL